eukprot:1478463-Pleurochrysis_carterae.AAC.2
MAQAGRRWQRTLFPCWLLDFGFTQCTSDPCVFTMKRNSPDDELVLGCYVGDLFVLHRGDGPESLYAKFTEALASNAVER